MAKYQFGTGCVTVALLMLIGTSSAIPKYDDHHKEIYPNNQWRRAYYSDQQANDTANNDRLQRLGFTTGYGGLNGYGQSGSGVGVYSPVKLDLGGVVLGTLVGIGAILIIPKLISVFSHGYSGYARNADDDLSGITELLRKFDQVLGQNNIDSASCMQRAVCSYIRSTESNMKAGSADQIDKLIHDLSENSLVEYMIDGTAVKEAIEHGKNVKGNGCDELYSACQVDSNSAMKILTTILPKPQTQDH